MLNGHHYVIIYNNLERVMEISIRTILLRRNFHIRYLITEFK